MGWQWHQLNHMQAICSSLHASTSSVRFLWARCSSWHPTNSIKVLKAKWAWEKTDCNRLLHLHAVQSVYQTSKCKRRNKSVQQDNTLTLTASLVHQQTHLLIFLIWHAMQNVIAMTLPAHIKHVQFPFTTNRHGKKCRLQSAIASACSLPNFRSY